MVSKIEELKMIVLNPHSPTDVDSISRTVELVFTAIISVEQLDFFATVTPSQVSAEHLAACLRFLWKLRKSIPNYNNALNVAKEACILCNIDPNDALYGMIDKY